VARHRGSTDAGPYLDSLADVASFGVAPAALVAFVVLDARSFATDPILVAAGVGVAALFVSMAVARLGMYTAYDADERETVGVPTTLAATVLAAAVIAGYTAPALLIAATAAFALLMGSTVTYPDLHAQDALVMGVVQAAVILTRSATWSRHSSRRGSARVRVRAAVPLRRLPNPRTAILLGRRDPVADGRGGRERRDGRRRR